MKLDLGIMAGPESKKFLVELTKLVQRMEAAATPLKGKKSASKKEELEDAEEEEIEEEDEANHEAEESEESDDADDSDSDETDSQDDGPEESDADDSDDSEEEEAEEKSTKKGKVAKVTAEQVNDAAKALHTFLVKKKKLTSKKAFAQIKATLNKAFDTESVSQIEKADLPKALKLLQAKAK